MAPDILRRAAAGLLLAAAGLAALQPAPARAGDARSAAFLGMTLIDMSPGERTGVEEARLAMVGERLREQLAASGRFEFVDTAPVAEKAAGYTNLSHCNGCDTDLASELGADLAVTGEVQKTSNLILHFSVYIRDAATGALVGGGSADIRSNTDESWRRGIDYIVKNRILRE